jgi:hypothetical protein
VILLALDSFMMNIESGGAKMMQEGVLNANDLPDDEESEAVSSSEYDGSVTNLKDRAAKETKRTLARNETRAGTLRQP